MTGKRFTIIDCGILGKCLRDNQSDINTDDLVIMSEWLNELHEDNQLLHKMNAEAIDFMYDNFDMNRMFTDRDLNDICNEQGWELSEKGIKINQLEKENEQLKCGNKNLKATLNDFINILNRLQANPNDKQTLSVARDMLQNMGVDLK